MTYQVRDGENVFRSAVFPVAFKKKRLSPKGFLKLWSSNENPCILEMSVVWRRFAPTDAMVHDFGCRLAASQNKGRVAAGQKADRVYCGAYQLNTKGIGALVNQPGLSEVTSATVVHEIEDGEVAHANCKILVDTGGDEAAIEVVKTAIIDRLWHACLGPARHVCLTDIALDPHPSQLLEDAPFGIYRDLRTAPKRMIDVLLCHLLYIPLARRQPAV
jgi:hypothetical protein